MNAFNLTFFDYYQIMLLVIIFIIGMMLNLLFGAKKRVDINIVILLYVWHTIFCLYYWNFTLNNVTDAVGYYNESLISKFNLYPGTNFVITFTSLFTKYLGFNYLNTALIYNIFGSLGLVVFYKILKPYIIKLGKLWFFILFFPSMSLWSSLLGKDSISFLAVCLFLKSVTEKQTRKLTFTIAFLLMFMMRPHIAIIMVISFIIYFIIKSKTHIALKALTLPIIVGATIIGFKFVQQYLGIDGLSLDSLSDYVDKRQGYNQEGGSSLDISSMSFPMQMFTYVFRPLPFEAHNIQALVTSIENTFFLLVVIYFSYKSNFNFNAYFKKENLWLFIYFFTVCSMLAVTTANLGIATRQKWMFMPIFIYLLIFSMYDYRFRKLDN